MALFVRMNFTCRHTHIYTRSQTHTRANNSLPHSLSLLVVVYFFCTLIVDLPFAYTHTHTHTHTLSLLLAPFAHLSFIHSYTFLRCELILAFLENTLILWIHFIHQNDPFNSSQPISRCWLLPYNHLVTWPYYYICYNTWSPDHTFTSISPSKTFCFSQRQPILMFRSAATALTLRVGLA